jgi:hypothetical protein
MMETFAVVPPSRSLTGALCVSFTHTMCAAHPPITMRTQPLIQQRFRRQHASAAAASNNSGALRSARAGEGCRISPRVRAPVVLLFMSFMHALWAHGEGRRVMRSY